MSCQGHLSQVDEAVRLLAALQAATAQWVNGHRRTSPTPRTFVLQPLPWMTSTQNNAWKLALPAARRGLQARPTTTASHPAIHQHSTPAGLCGPRCTDPSAGALSGCAASCCRLADWLVARCACNPRIPRSTAAASVRLRLGPPAAAAGFPRQAHGQQPPPYCALPASRRSSAVRVAVQLLHVDCHC